MIGCPTCLAQALKPQGALGLQPRVGGGPRFGFRLGGEPAAPVFPKGRLPGGAFGGRRRGRGSGGGGGGGAPAGGVSAGATSSTLQCEQGVGQLVLGLSGVARGAVSVAGSAP